MGVLTDARHELFAQNRAGGTGKAESAIAAGFSEKSAHVQANRLLKKDKIVARIQELQERAATQVVLSQSWVLERLVEVHTVAMEGQPVLDRYGKASGAVLKNLSAANRALELIGKSDGINCFTEKSETTHHEGGEVAQMMKDIADRAIEFPVRKIPTPPVAKDPQPDNEEAEAKITHPAFAQSRSQH